MKSVTPRNSAATTKLVAALATVLVGGFAAGSAHAAAAKAGVIGEIEHITLNDPTDHWSGGTIEVAGHSIILPKNLLLDLPANRLTLWQLFDQAPEPCRSRGETGLAKGDTCNTAGMGGIASISANKTLNGNVIAGDVLIEKGQEDITGTVTYINYDEGYLRIDGTPGADTGGFMARMNDPTTRHTVQVGKGCSADTIGHPNCSADPRFALDADNYVNVATTGYPMCIPSTISRSWTAGFPASGTGFDVSPAVTGSATVKAVSNTGVTAGTGDLLCPDTNRTADLIVADSRRFAPIKVGDSIQVQGNFETVDGVRFLSFHTSTTLVALATKSALTQPDYMIPEEVFVEAPAFENLRTRSLLIGFSTRPPDILFWTLHYDPVTGTRHEKPYATTAGCDAVTAVGTCSAAGLLGAPNLGAAGGNIFRIRYDIDFVIGAKALLDPCAHLNAEPRFGVASFCPGWTTTGKPALYNAQAIADMFAVLSPEPHELQARTGHALAAKKAGYDLQTVDIKGAAATNGQYLYPLGINLGGIEMADFLEINVGALNKPTPFSGIPWNLDRRLSPNGCRLDAAGVPACDATPQPLTPFPYEGYDPRTQTNGCAAGTTCELPSVAYNDPAFTGAPLGNVRNRVLSYMTRIGTTTPARYDFAGDASLLAWPPVDPAAMLINPTPTIDYCISELGNCLPVPVLPVCNPGDMLNAGTLSCVTPTPACGAGQVLQGGVCTTPVLTCGTGQVASGGFCIASVPTCSATQTLTNNVCINKASTCAAGQLVVNNVCVTPDTITTGTITWAAQGGNRGVLTVFAKSNIAAAVLSIKADVGTTNVLPVTTMTRVTTSQGGLTCSVLSPCYTLAAARLTSNIKPTAITITSDKLGTKIVTTGF